VTQQSLDVDRWRQAGSVAGDVLPFSGTGLPAARSYYYRIGAFNSRGSYGFTTPVHVATLS
jgi:hypothetical protein